MFFIQNLSPFTFHFSRTTRTAFLSSLRECISGERRQRWRMLESVQLVLRQGPFGMEGPLSCVPVSVSEPCAVPIFRR